MSLRAMSEQSARDGLLRSLDRIRATANELEREIVELHNIILFDYSPRARERASGLETEMSQLAAALRRFRERFEG